MRVQYGHVDVLVCAAAVQGPLGPFVENPPEEWAETMSTNLMGVANSIRAVCPKRWQKRFASTTFRST
jgi:3-oxoacyl-[acyl-carrier protein] reductase